MQQLKAAHSKVKSGADFPAYIRKIKALGVTHYDTYVNNGHILRILYEKQSKTSRSVRSFAL